MEFLFLDELPGVQPPHAGSPPPAARGEPRHHQPGDGQPHVSRQLHARRRHEPLPLRLPRRPPAACNCTPPQIERYLSRICGPLLDRIDLHVEVPPVPFRELADTGGRHHSAQMREQVVAARDRQTQRFQPR